MRKMKHLNTYERFGNFATNSNALTSKSYTGMYYPRSVKYLVYIRNGRCAAVLYRYIYSSMPPTNAALLVRPFNIASFYCFRRERSVHTSNMDSTPYVLGRPSLSRNIVGFVADPQITQHAKYTCSFCGKETTRRQVSGIWKCSACKTISAGGAYTLQ